MPPNACERRFRGGFAVHSHFSALTALNVFLAVLMVGTLWRLLALRAAGAQSTTLRNLGAAMAFQY
jgi:hypothetical protein